MTFSHLLPGIIAGSARRSARAISSSAASSRRSASCCTTPPFSDGTFHEEMSLKSRLTRPPSTVLGALALALCLVATAPSPAVAANVTAPIDGASVPSRPTFTWDYLYGAATIEWSRAPDVRTSGDQVGRLVDPAGSVDEIFGTTPRSSTVLRERLDSGVWFWTARLRDDGSPEGFGEQEPWLPVRRFVVDDEPPEIEGWTLNASRVRPRGTCDRVRLRGVVRTDDNEPEAKVRITLVVRAGGRTLFARGPSADEGVVAFDREVCTRSGALEVEAHVADSRSQVTRTQPRTVRVPAAARRSTPAIVRQEFRDWKTAIRTGDGSRACELMEPPYRALFRRAVDEIGLADSCEEAVNLFGRGAYERFERYDLGRVRVRGRYAVACVKPRDGSVERFVRSGTSWRLHLGTRRTSPRFPRITC